MGQVDRPQVHELLEGAAAGSQAAWDALVDRYGGLVWGVVRSFRLDPATAADVSQTTWLRLVENLHKIRQPEALPGWLATTARREALRVLKHKQRVVPTVAVEAMLDPVFADPAADLLANERDRDLVAAFSQLSDDCRQLLRLLTSDPPLEYAEISKIIDRPVGSIGPTRARCLERLRRKLVAEEATHPSSTEPGTTP